MVKLIENTLRGNRRRGNLVGGRLAGILETVWTTATASYITTAYHTCLFLWARDVERASVTQPDRPSVPAPAPLAAVLGG